MNIFKILALVCFALAFIFQLLDANTGKINMIAAGLFFLTLSL